MKNQQVSVNIPLMIKTALIYLGLALSGWMLLRLLQACLWLPGYLKNQTEDTRSFVTESEVTQKKVTSDVKKDMKGSTWKRWGSGARMPPCFCQPFHSHKFIQMSLEHGLEKSDDLPCPAPISRLRVEKIEGGLVVAGVVVAANCQIALPVFGCLFILVGIVLSVASYRGPGQDEAPENYAARLAFTGNSRILGPACIVVGFVMLSAGIALCLLTKRARKREKRVGFHCPIHGDFYPLSPVTASKALGKYEAGWGLCFGRTRNFGMDKMPCTPPQCPHTQMSSTRSSFSSVPFSPCPTPVPFLFASNSISSDLANSVGVNVSPDQTFGSIRSLSVSREVASFPLSRTPSPPSPEDRYGHSEERSRKISQKQEGNVEVIESIQNFTYHNKNNNNHSKNSNICSTGSCSSSNNNNYYYKADNQEFGNDSSKFPQGDARQTEIQSLEQASDSEVWNSEFSESSRKSVSVVIQNEENG